MSVVVVGMDYPENCCVCKIKSWDIEGYVCPFSGVDTLNIGRQINCPLRPLPEKHGRLIDISDFDEMHFKDGLKEGEKLYVPFEEIAEIIFKTKTIVEAEGE